MPLIKIILLLLLAVAFGSVLVILGYGLITFLTIVLAAFSST